MEVRNTLGVVALSIVISSCSPSSKVATVTEPLTKAKCTGSAAITSTVIVEWEDGHISFEKVDDIEKFKAEFVTPQVNSIKRVQFDQKIQLRPSQSLSTGFAVTSSSDDWGQQMIQLGLIDSQEKGGEGIIVGVVDAFVDVSHIQLKGQIAINAGEVPNNGIDDDGNGVVDDYLGASFVSGGGSSVSISAHGTHVSGIIAADPKKGPVQGVAPKAKIVPAQFIGNDESGSLSDAIRALEYVSSRGAKIINASWGGAPCVGALATEFSQLEQKGILLVVAAGNDGSDLDSHPTFPAAFSFGNQVTVAASTEADFMAQFSNSSFDLVHLAAPGVNIKSTIPGNLTDFMSGTSMAAPFVSGSAALLWSLRPQATAQDIKRALLESVDVVPNHEFRVQTQGRLNVYKAYQKLKAMIP